MVIEEIKPQERKITLAPGDSADEHDWRKYAQAKAPIGALGEKLQKALDSKKKS